MGQAHASEGYSRALQDRVILTQQLEEQSPGWRDGEELTVIQTGGGRKRADGGVVQQLGVFVGQDLGDPRDAKRGMALEGGKEIANASVRFQSWRSCAS